MKKIILIIFGFIPLICYGFEMNNVQFPQAQFQSVNNIKSSTNYTPHITTVGACSIQDVSTSSGGTYKLGMRKVNIHEDPNEPYLTPIGDTPWVLMILLIGFYILRKKWKRMHSLPL